MFRVSLVSVFAIAFVAAASANDDIAALVKQLDHDEFAQREAAGERLAALGAAAIPVLAEATGSTSPEVSMRAFNVIVRQLNDGDEDAKKAAMGALEQIANSDMPFAERAKKVLQPSQPAPQLYDRFGRPWGGIERPPVRVPAMVRRRVSVAVERGGAQRVEVHEGDRTVVISDHPENGITVEVTDEKDGKKETKKYQAANAEELKEKHPEAHKLYEQHAKNTGVIRRDPPKIAADHFKRSEKHLDDMIKRLQEQIEGRDANAELQQRMIEQIERHKEIIADHQKRFEETRKKHEEMRDKLRREFEERRQPPGGF